MKILVSYATVRNFMKIGVLFVGRDSQTLCNSVIFKFLSWVIFLSQEKICRRMTSPSYVCLFVCVCVCVLVLNWCLEI